jgi:probable F420-dependent oxidoreductase
VKFGVFFAAVNPFATPEVIAAVGQACEERSVDSIWVPEHVVLFDEYEHRYPYADDGTFPALPNSGMLEPFSTLSFLAAHTSTARLATGICLLPQRNPVYTAKEVANVDYLSGGRFDFGIGVGWCAEEFEVVNVPFETRGRRTDEYIDVMKTLWRDEQSEFHGVFYDLPACTMYPKPVQAPNPPLVLGGESDAAMRRAARVGQGWHTFNRLPPDMPALLSKLEGFLAEAGRSRDDLVVTASPYFNGIDPDMVEQFADAGVDQVTALLVVPSLADVEPAFDGLAACIERAHQS